MPRVSRKIKRRRRPTEYQQKHVTTLLTGRDFSCSAFGHSHDPDYAAMRLAWHELRDELLPAWIAEHPRTRPAAWWRFDASGRRERIDGGIHPFDRMNYPEHLKTLSFGRPHNHLTADDMSARYETEEDFLRRHELLTPEEM